MQGAIHDEFAARLAARVAAMRIGPGADDPELGPMINDAAVGKISAHVDDALSRGARNLAPRDDLPDGPRFVAPVVLAGATDAMRLAQEETFGPVAPLFRFSHEAEAIELANATPYGLAAYFFTDCENRPWRWPDWSEPWQRPEPRGEPCAEGWRSPPEGPGRRKG